MPLAMLTMKKGFLVSGSFPIVLLLRSAALWAARAPLLITNT